MPLGAGLDWGQAYQPQGFSAPTAEARITLTAPARSQVLRGDQDPIFPPE